MRQCEIKELHTGVLRIVAFEFLREHNRRHACRAKRKAEQDGDVRMDIELASAPMALTLSGDMLTLANLVKHFDFVLASAIQKLVHCAFAAQYDLRREPSTCQSKNWTN
eukprot:2695194-Amphidinium_carterae.1